MRLLALLLCLSLPTLAQAEQSIRQFQTAVSAPAQTIVQNLQATLPETVLFSSNAGATALSYTGQNTPPAMLSFLTATYPDLPVQALGPGKPVMIGVEISTDSLITAMISARFPADARALTLPQGAQVLLDADLPGDCATQQVIAHPGDIVTTATTYKTHLANQGFTLETPSPEEVSYFIGRSDSCTAILYLQPDPDDANATLVVIRLLED